MPSNTRGSILLSTAENVGTILKKKLSSPTGFSPSEWADAINLLGALPVKTASGSIAHFSDGADTVPLKSSKFYITPTQASGTPTPSNPLPISGHTGLTITRTGANLFDISTIDSIDTDGNGTMRNGCIFSLRGAFTASGVQTENAYIYGKIKSGSTYGSIIYFTSGSPTTFSRTLTINQGEELLIYDGSSVATMSASTERLGIIKIELGNTATAYEPYTATTYPVSWSEQGTVYGGYFKDGELWKTHILETYTGASGESWTIASDNTQRIAKPSSAKVSDNTYSNMALITSASSPAWGYFRLGASNLIINLGTFSNVSDFKTWLGSNNLQMVYELATPVKVADLEEVEITSLLGVNNIWCDTGDCEVEYRADIDLLITSLGG